MDIRQSLERLRRECIDSSSYEDPEQTPSR
jgi:hypothetical protein